MISILSKRDSVELPAQGHSRVVRGVAPFLLCLASMVFASPASASASSMAVSGPATITMGSNFNYVITGDASGSANRVVAWEQYDKVNGCAPTFAGESVRAIFEPASVYGLTEWTNEAVKGTYSVTAAFGAKNPGVHGMCAYLINYTTGQTYAHAGAFWTNVSS